MLKNKQKATLKLWFVGQEVKAICTLHVEGEIGRFLVFRHLQYANIRKSLYMVT